MTRTDSEADTRYEAVCSRDARFDGEFFFAVVTTGIYCRPSCPAVTPKRQNVTFFPSAAAAQRHGFRACRRCRPDAVPGSAAWNVRADVVARAMRLIGDGVVDREGVPGLAERLGYSARQVQRLLNAELGAGPVALARAQRAHTARTLLQTTSLPVTEIAFASGYSSVRQFNDTIREIYARTPSELRAERRGRAAAGLGGVPLRLAYRGAYAAREVFDLLEGEAVDGVEEVAGRPGARTYRRTLRLPYGSGIAAVDERSSGPWLDSRIHLSDLRDLTTAVQRLRRLFDLDADPYAVAERLGPLAAARPGLRSPGAAEPEEFAVRAVVGHAEARRLVEAYGTPLDTPCGGLTHLFPEPAALVGHPGAGALAAALAGGDLRLDPGADRDEAERALRALPGVGARPAALIRMRALGDPDVALDERADREEWRPWRSYATRYLAGEARGGVLPILPGSRRLARALAALSSVADGPRSPSGTGGAPTAWTPSSALRSHAPPELRLGGPPDAAR
ncbi:Ada metal-binding domain-containing protein [Streptomyces sp. NPDC006307]|uniref:DNA-3-methyladenine glycosylase 2 family protein n=1 Tax=Streptomyces sp. NPDC006307 TaxID=3156748 RepID=UPI0033B1B06C